MAIFMKTYWQALIVILFFSTAALAETRYVANNGLDSETCGAKSSPCRSISQGIVNAGVNDTIQVGPGLYGDLNFDGDLEDEGEENALNEDGALISISKPVRIVSTLGAFATFVNANAITDFVFYIKADDVRIGKKKKGFTIRGGDDVGVFVEGDRVRIFGNTIASGGNGIRVGCYGSDDFGAPERGAIGHNAVIFNEDTGIHLCDNSSRFGIRKNNISNNGGYGIQALGTQHKMIANNISGNGEVGVSITAATSRLVRNIVVGNQSSGVSSSGDNLFAKSNSIIGNRSIGIFFFEDTTLQKNNVFGNYPLDGSLYSNCGVFDNADSSTVNGTFYGESTGPGSNPADLYCSQIKLNEDLNFASSQYSIRVPKPLQ
jgi:hypothetical protein